MMKKIFYLLILIIFSTSVLADLSDYPNLFSSEKTVQSVKGAHGNSRQTQASMNLYYTLPANLKYEPRLDNPGEVTDLTTDFILIGSPCQNLITKNFFPDQSCDLPGDETLIKFEERNGQKLLLIMSGSDNELVTDSLAIRKNIRIFSKVKGNQAILKAGELKDEAAVKEEAPVETKQETKVANTCEGCSTDSGCINVNELSSINGKPAYCTGDHQLKEQKNEGDSCEANYECLNNSCLEKVCKLPSAWSKLVTWIKNLF